MQFRAVALLSCALNVLAAPLNAKAGVLLLASPSVSGFRAPVPISTVLKDPTASVMEPPSLDVSGSHMDTQGRIDKLRVLEKDLQYRQNLERMMNGERAGKRDNARMMNGERAGKRKTGYKMNQEAKQAPSVESSPGPYAPWNNWGESDPEEYLQRWQMYSIRQRYTSEFMHIVEKAPEGIANLERNGLTLLSYTLKAVERDIALLTRSAVSAAQAIGRDDRMVQLLLKFRDLLLHERAIASSASP